MQESEECKQLRQQLRALKNNLVTLTGKKITRERLITTGFKKRMGLKTTIEQLDATILLLEVENKQTQKQQSQMRIFKKKLSTLERDLSQFASQLPPIKTQEITVEGKVARTTQKMMDEDCVLN